MFKQIFALSAALSLSVAAMQAQTPEPYEFKEFKKVACTPIKNQEQTGTCWAFSTASFLESEAIRLGKGEYNLSEMYVVRHIYRRKCENYVRRQGHAQFGEGGLAHDLLNAVRDHGIVPEDVYPGRKDPSQPLNHGKVVEDLKSLCDKLVEKGGKGDLEANWGRQIDSLLDVHFGVVPQKFMVGAISMTPITFRDYIGINPEEYVSITSFSHHPFLQPFVLEIPDNFDNGLFYNLPLEDMMKTLNYALQQGYSVEWDADEQYGFFG
jgi:bleomycin hydrolase